MKVLVIGGTGFIGRRLTRALVDAGQEVTVVSRRTTAGTLLPGGVAAWQADIAVPGPWQDLIPDYEAIVNLSGDSIFRRWTRRGKMVIINSRVVTTGNIMAALKKQKGNVRHYCGISGVGYYGFHGDEALDETALAGSDFIAGVAARWEETALPARDLGIRLSVCRLGHVMGVEGGALPKLTKLAKFHLASCWGSGDQWISWVHLEDVSRALVFLLSSPDISGAVNFCSPEPARNRELMRTLAKITNKRVLIPPVPGFALKLVLGEFSSVFLNGQRVVPAVLLKNNFQFKYSGIEEALEDLLNGK